MAERRGKRRLGLGTKPAILGAMAGLSASALACSGLVAPPDETEAGALEAGVDASTPIHVTSARVPGAAGGAAPRDRTQARQERSRAPLGRREPPLAAAGPPRARRLERIERLDHRHDQRYRVERNPANGGREHRQYSIGVTQAECAPDSVMYTITDYVAYQTQLVAYELRVFGCSDGMPYNPGLGGYEFAIIPANYAGPLTTGDLDALVTCNKPSWSYRITGRAFSRRHSSIK
jgi:hypothetical protein